MQKDRSSTATLTNKSVSLSSPSLPRPRLHHHITSLQKDLLSKHKILLNLTSCPDSTPAVISTANDEYLKSKSSYRQAVRSEQKEDSIKRDEKLSQILTNNPTSLFRTIKDLKNPHSCKIHKLHVGDTTYVGDEVPSGFFASLSALKSPDMSSIHSTPQYQSTLTDFQHILKICRSGSPIPDISPKSSTQILMSLKSEVTDFYSITASHFVNAGHSGFAYFHYLLFIY